MSSTTNMIVPTSTPALDIWNQSTSYVLTTTKLATYIYAGNVSDTTDYLLCPQYKPDSEFPDDLFTVEQRRRGLIVLHMFAAIYAIIFAEHVCDEYLMPSFEYLSYEMLKLNSHVAGATVLAISSSFSELVTSLIGVFMAKNDIAINALLGSGAYNLLVIISICSFCVYKLDIKLKMYPVIRDTFFYSLNLILLLVFLFKNNFSFLFWYDSLILILLYTFYILVNIYDEWFTSQWAKIKKRFQSCAFFAYQKKAEANGNHIELNLEARIPKSGADEVNKTTTSTNRANVDLDAVTVEAVPMINKLKPGDKRNRINMLADDDISSLSSDSVSGEYENPYNLTKPYKKVQGLDLSHRIFLYIVFPARFLAFISILDFRRFDKNRKKFIILITFFMSIAWVSASSYMLVWMVMVIAETYGMSETILGFTFVAAATGLEETVTSICLCKREVKRYSEGKLNYHRLNGALSNCIGSNIFDISIGIGLPYLVNSLFFTNGTYFSYIYNQNISFTIFGLLVSIVFFVSLLFVFRWRLTKLFGFSLLFIWIVFTTLVILIDFKVIKLNMAFLGIQRC